MEIESEDKETIFIDKYPDWCKDDIDKIIHEIIIKKGRRLTFNVLQNQLVEIYLERICSTKLIDKLKYLKDQGILDVKPKEVNPIELWQAKEEEQEDTESD